MWLCTVYTKYRITHNFIQYMVRNLIGGNQAKRQARKFPTNNGNSHSELQLSTNEYEVYACVLKIFGGTISVVTVNDITLLCTIRNKFKGRSKRNNLIEIGSVVLVGLFPWQSADNKVQRCDLITIYDANEYQKLLLIPATKIYNLEKHMIQSVQESTDSNIVFSLQDNNDTVNKMNIPINNNDDDKNVLIEDDLMISK